MQSDKRNRVFWLGMHVVLTKTELPRLRALGYEVFNPPYLAEEYDQSAVTDWDRGQPTTLPSEVFCELSQYNFFYNRISPRIAELLNEYFGTVIVTISPYWLQSMLDAFRGRIIYRTFGQPGTLCDPLWALRLFRAIQERDDFHFVPHAEETTRDEHAWLRTRMSVVPYTIPLDVFQHEGTWSLDEPREREIMACCPNIENSYYAQQYHFLNAHFPEPYFKLYGVQPRRHADPRLVGTLPRDAFLDRYRQASGYWYHYGERNTCYLPPIEMMTIGGPVIYQRGSLLARYFRSPGPGEATNVEDARRKIELLLDGERGFVNELQDAQQQVVRRYHPDYVHPIFDRTFRQLIDRPDVPRQEPAVLGAGGPPGPRKRIFVFFHAVGQHVTFADGKYEAADDLARGVSTIVRTLLDETDHEVVVTCFAEGLSCAFGYLRAEKFPGRLRFMVVDPDELAPDGFKALQEVLRNVRKRQFGARPRPALREESPPESVAVEPPATRGTPSPVRWQVRWVLACAVVAGKSRILLGTLLLLARSAIRLLRRARRARAWLGVQQARTRAWLGRCWRALRTPDPWISRHRSIEQVNAESGDVVVIVPHGTLFPEALLVQKPLILCLSEASPGGGQSPETPAGLRGKLYGAMGRLLAEKAAEELACSEIMQSDLLLARRTSDPARGAPLPRPAGIQHDADRKPVRELAATASQKD
jgi:hypothetical protein